MSVNVHTCNSRFYLVFLSRLIKISSSVGQQDVQDSSEDHGSSRKFRMTSVDQAVDDDSYDIKSMTFEIVITKDEKSKI